MRVRRVRGQIKNVRIFRAFPTFSVTKIVIGWTESVNLFRIFNCLGISLSMVAGNWKQEIVL